jgi:hypothetical protein
MPHKTSNHHEALRLKLYEVMGKFSGKTVVEKSDTRNVRSQYSTYCIKNNFENTKNPHILAVCLAQVFCYGENMSANGV